MKTKICTTLAALALSCSMWSCFDNNYDLSDIDKTVQVQVNELQLTTSIDPIKMQSILNESNELKSVDGQYAYCKSGTFHSSDISINSFVVESPDIAPSSLTFSPVQPASRAVGDIVCSLSDSDMSQLDIDVNDVDNHIIALTKVCSDVTLTLAIDASALKESVNSVVYNTLIFKLRPQMVVESVTPNGTYDPETGTLTVENLSVSTDKDAIINVRLRQLTIFEDEYSNSHLAISNEIGLVSGQMTIPVDAVKEGSSVPSPISLTLNYSLPTFDVEEISGKIQYEIEDFNINDIDINGLPDFLTQKGTNLLIQNPQVFMSITNSLYEYPIYAEIGLEAVSYKDGKEVGAYGIDGGTFRICERSGSTPQKETYYCLSPDGGTNPDYPNAKQVKYTKLGQVLSDPDGNGVPTLLKLNLTNPNIPEQSVDNFLLKPYDALQGKYDLIAPLQLASGSQIVYTDTITGWGSEDLDALAIRLLSVSLTLTNDVPLNVKFTGYPIDADGNKINNVDITGATINANEANKPIEIKITGEVKGLDGIIFEAVAQPSDNNAVPLRPDMTLTITDLKVKVSATYEKEL